MTDPEKFCGKFRVKSSRLKYFNYGENGYYFVTICTAKRIPYFGEINNGIINLSSLGETTTTFWTQIPAHFPFVKLYEFAVMPNHIHGILVIDKSDSIPTKSGDIPMVETHNCAPLQITTNRFGPQSNNLASIVRNFKAAVKKYATMNEILFSWQSRFYDHIIRNEKSLSKIREYIRSNPLMWDKDEYYR